MQKLILIDGHAILHRAFHALPPLTNKDGEIVNAVYGFFSMFLKILEDLKPDYIVVCFDRKAPTFRKQLYVGYQATRPTMSDDLVPQIEILHEILNKAKVNIFEVDGYEADDLIGTISVQAIEKEDSRGLKVDDSNLKIEDRKSIDHQASTLKKPSSTNHHQSSNLEVIIVSGDRDLLQLVNYHVKVLAPIVGLTKMILFDENKVIEKYGLKPSQFIDYKALVGDQSDNYPGVNGIGPKTAMNLLKKYDNFENLYTHVSELPEKIALKLSTDAEQAALAKKLATVITDAPINLKLKDCRFKDLDMKGLREEFEKQGFKSLLLRVDDKRQEVRDNKKKNSSQMELL